MESHPAAAPAEPSRPWFAMLLIIATLLAAGLLCSDALDRLAPDTGTAETETPQPDVALVVDRIAPAGETALVAIDVDAPADSAVIAGDAGAAEPAAPTPDAIQSSVPPPNSNGNTNPHANPNGHTNNANPGNGQHHRAP